MKSKLLTSLILLAGLATFGNNAATASDEFAGAVIGAGTGAVLGHVVGGRDAAVVGGIIGAMIGVAAADDDDRHVVRHSYRARHAPPPVVVYNPPRIRHAPPVWVSHRHDHRDWRDDRHGRFDRRDRSDGPGRGQHDRWESRGW